MIAGLAITLFALTACSVDPPSQAALASKLKTEADFKVLPAKQLDCIAGVLLKYAKASDLKDYVDGKKSVGDVRGPKDNEDEVTKESTACVTNNPNQ